jgi:copper chaperone CopZ
MSKVILQIVGDHKMTCGGCEGRVQNSLLGITGVSGAKADRETQHVEVTLASDSVTLEQMQASLQMIGYEAEVV